MIYSLSHNILVPYSVYTSGNPGVIAYRKLLEERTMNGQDRLNWKQIIKEGENATNVMNATERKLSLITALAVRKTISFKSVPVPPSTVGAEGYPFSPRRAVLSDFAWDLYEVQSRCSAEFANNVRDRIQQMGGPEFLLELKETLSMIRRPAKAIDELTRKYATAARRATQRDRVKYQRYRYTKSERARMRTNELNDLYLTYEFGVRPLVGDIQDAAGLLAQMVSRPKEKRVTATTRNQPMCKPRTIIGNLNIGNNVSLIHAYDETCEVSCITKGAIKAKYIAPTGKIDELLRGAGLIDTDFLPTIWNWIPFSFVVDYFANVNDVLIGAYASEAYLEWSAQTTRVLVTLNGSIDANNVFEVPDPSSQRLASALNIPGRYVSTAKQVTRRPSPVSIQLTSQAPSLKQVFNIVSLVKALNH